MGPWVIAQHLWIMGLIKLTKAASNFFITHRCIYKKTSRVLRISWWRGEVRETSKGCRIPADLDNHGCLETEKHICPHHCTFQLWVVLHLSFLFLISFQGSVPSRPRKGHNLQNPPLFVYRNWTLQLTTENWAWSKPPEKHDTVPTSSPI